MKLVHAQSIEAPARDGRPFAIADDFRALGRQIRAWYRRASCATWGHQVDNHVLARQQHRECRCGAAYLSRDRSLTRVRHTLSCFLGHHSYQPLIDRDACREYVCRDCGHPLVFRDASDPYRRTTAFKKKARYLCGLFGHRVEIVARREGRVEYACHCGHTFLKRDGHARTIRHPMICVLLGHFVEYVTARGGYDEFLCVNCGHPFCFSAQTVTRTSTPSSDRSARHGGPADRPR